MVSMDNPYEIFTVLFGLTEAVGALLMILVCVWLGSYRGGFGWTSNPKLEFNWHPLFMTIGMIFLYGNAILIYRAFRFTRKRKLKIIHAVINMLAFVVTVIALQAVFDSHNLASPPIKNMYSLHSWVGLGSVIIFACQWLAGFIIFLFPSLNAQLRAAYYPFHILCGIGAFICAVTSALMGLTEKAIFSVEDYSKLSAEGVLVNVIGLFIIFFTCFVMYLVCEPKFKRQPMPEDEMLLTTTE